VAQGILILVVGPSGAGKDTLLDAARAQLSDDQRIVFPIREITRPAEAGGEIHIPVDPAAFARRRADGEYALSWEAHGLGYGVPASIERDLAAGRTVVLNVSRAVLEEARQRFAAVRVVNLSVPEAVLRQRLAARGREETAEIDRRVARAAAFVVTGDDVVTIVNDGPLALSASRFVAAILAPSATSSNGNTNVAED